VADKEKRGLKPTPEGNEERFFLGVDRKRKSRKNRVPRWSVYYGGSRLGGEDGTWAGGERNSKEVPSFNQGIYCITIYRPTKARFPIREGENADNICSVRKIRTRPTKISGSMEKSETDQAKEGDRCDYIASGPMTAGTGES